MKWFEFSSSKKISFLEKKLENNHKNIWNLYLAFLYFEQNLLDKAEIICMNFKRFYPDNTIANIILAKIYIAQLKLNKAKDLLIHTNQMDCDNLVVISLLGDIALQKQEYEQACTFYSKLLEIDPLSKVSQNKLKKSKNILKKKKQESFPVDNNSRARMLGLDQAELKEIKNVFNEIEQVEKDDDKLNELSAFPDTSITEAVAAEYEKKGELVKAAKVYQALLEKKPLNEKFDEKYRELTKKKEN